MFLNDILQVFLGVLIGMVTGIIPGLHVNTIIPLVSPSLVLVGIGISHTFFDFIPSLVLGVPDESSSVASLPGHRLVLEGRGKEAFLLSVLGGLFSSIALIVILPFLVAFSEIKKAFAFFSLLAFLILVFSERHKLIALLVLALSSGLAFLVNPFSPGVLTVYFAGLFGVPTLVYSILTRSKIPHQRDPGRMKVNPMIPMLSALGGSMAGVLPGITSSISAVSLSSFLSLSDEEKVMLVGGINTVYVLTTILAIWILGYPRSVLARSVSGIGFKVVPAAFLAVSISSLLAWYLGPRILHCMSRVNSRILNSLVLAFLVGFVIVLFPDKFPVFTFSSALGIILYSLGIRRSIGISFLLVPIIIS